MTTLVVPPIDEEPWPTLGPQVVAFIRERAVHGPGDLRGELARVDAETAALIYRAYEVYPRTVTRAVGRGFPGIRVNDPHPQAGRRRFKRVGISLRKGTAKTEKAAWVSYTELHPEGPVRCDGFDSNGHPVGMPVRDPYIPMVAYTEEQTEELAYGALYVVVTEGPDVDLFDPGLERIARVGGDGKAEALSSSPNANDGARTTFQHFDETHRMMLARLVAAHQTMLANIPKRRLADAWSLETTTAPEPGAGAVGEKTMNYAEAVAAGKVKDAKLFFFHRQASKGLADVDEGLAEVPEEDRADVRRAAVRELVLEASGPAAEWSDIGAIVDLILDPTTDRAYAERVWLNRKVAGGRKAFDAEKWKRPLADGGLANPDFDAPKKALITVGFDGARYHDATALIATHIFTGLQWPLGIWEQPYGPAGGDWEVPENEVDDALEAAFDIYNVWRVYADPPYWQEKVNSWSGKYGEKRVIEWWTNRQKQMAFALRGYSDAMKNGAVTHNGDETFARHIGNAYRRDTHWRDDREQPYWLIQKERPDSPNKIDAAMAGCLSWEARGDAIAAGALKKKPRRLSTFQSM